MKFIRHVALIFLLQFAITSIVYAQEDSIRKRNLFKVGLSPSVGLSVGRTVSGVWHKANISAGVGTQFGVSLSENVWLNTGVSFDFFSYRSGPFVAWGIERFSERNQTYLNLPMSIEYSSPNKIGWYAQVGSSFGFNLMDEEINRGVYNNILTYWNGSGGTIPKIGPSHHYASLFLNASGGFQFRNGRSVYKVGLKYEHSVANYDYVYWQRGIHALRFEFGIQQELTGNRIRKLASRTYENRENKKNYLYLELVGNPFMAYSINYERSLIARESFRFNVRSGAAISLWLAPEKLPNMFMLGGLCAFGGSHSIELGMNGALYSIWGGDISDSEFILIPTLGYRFEHKTGIFTRLSFTPHVSPFGVPDQQFLRGSIVGVSIGGHF